jgi:hypothetical protein
VTFRHITSNIIRPNTVKLFHLYFITNVVKIYDIQLQTVKKLKLGRYNVHGILTCTYNERYRLKRNVKWLASVLKDVSKINKGKYDILVKESLLIAQTKPWLNNNVRSFPLTLF